MIIYFQQQLGPLAYPLLLCSLVAAVIILERFIILTLTALTGRLNKDGAQLLVLHSGEDKPTREEIASIWLQSRQQRLATGIRLLQIVALISPLLGLLGTVAGLIEVFDGLGAHSGPIEPSLLAGGLGIAMKTTAAGLIIAVPALLGAQVFQLWVEKLIHAAEKSMNLHSLKNDGISIEALV